MQRARSSAAAALVVAIFLFAAACGSSGSDKASSDTGTKADTSAASDTSDTGNARSDTDTGSSDTGSGDTAGHDANANGLKAAVKDYATKLISDDPSGAYEYLTADCRAKVDKAAFTSEVKQGIDAVKQYASNGKRLSIGPVQTKDVTKTKGRVAIELLGDDGKPVSDGTETDSSEPSFEDWEYTDGEWHPSGCNGMDDTADSASFTTVGSEIS